MQRFLFLKRAIHLTMDFLYSNNNEVTCFALHPQRCNSISWLGQTCQVEAYKLYNVTFLTDKLAKMELAKLELAKLELAKLRNM